MSLWRETAAPGRDIWSFSHDVLQFIVIVESGEYVSVVHYGTK